MKTNLEAERLNVQTEIGRLRKLIIHSPDSGLGMVVPSKAQDWLFEDIVHLSSIRKNEYDYYLKLLMYFMDPQKIQGKLKAVDGDNRAFYKPQDPNFHNSENILEVQKLISDLLEDHLLKHKLVAAIAAFESISYHTQEALMALEPKILAEVLISGTMPNKEMIFAPAPNFIFTRDLGTMINGHILLNKPAKRSRQREALLMKYIFFNHPIFADYKDKILEVTDFGQHFLKPGDNNASLTTIEGGDVMIVSPQHLLIGVSERTTFYGANEAIKLLFKHRVVEQVTVVQIPNKRDFMHLDTVMTQVKRNVWVILKSIAKNPTIDPNEPIHQMVAADLSEHTTALQFHISDPTQPKRFENVEALLEDICMNELKSTEPTKIIYSGSDEFPFATREQWTDSCNLVALKEGVVIGYDRNDVTVKAFKENGFQVVHVQDLLEDLEAGRTTVDAITDTLILLPSSELSRARGGFHCMSFPILRDNIL